MKSTCITVIAYFGFYFLNTPLHALSKDPVIATVNSIQILQSQFDEAYRKNKLYVSHMKVTKQKVLNDLINRILGIQRGLKQNLEKDPIVKAKMNDVLYHAQVSRDLAPRLHKITIKNKEIAEYYKNFPEYKTAHILIRESLNLKSKEKIKNMTHARSLYKELKKSPEKFTEFAKKHSQSASAPLGGVMNFEPAVRLAPEYFEAIKDQPMDTILSPIRTQFGIHIIKVMGIKKYKDINKAIYQKIIYDQKRDKIMANYFKNLRDAAEITLNL